MYERHGITTGEAEEALTDPERVVLEPDYASRSGRSVRIIGWCTSRSQCLTIIAICDAGAEYGASGWLSNEKDRLIYQNKGA